MSEAASSFLPPSYRALGLPSPLVRNVVHNRATGRTIVEVQLDETPPEHRLYSRTARESRYEPLLGPASSYSHEDVITSTGPLIFVRAVEWARREGGFSARTVDVLKIELQHEVFVQRLAVSDFLPDGASVSRLLRVNDSGTCIDAVVLLREPKPTGGKRARYAICAIDIDNRSFVELDTLAGIHF